MKQVLPLLIALAGSAEAETLRFPGNAVQTANVIAGDASHSYAVAAWSNGAVNMAQAEGTLTRQAWRIPAQGIAAEQLLRPLREQLRTAGYEIAFECADATCGGFDFRFALNVLPPPDMFVDLGDFRYLAARRDSEVVTLLTSGTADAGYVQVSRIGSVQSDAIVETSASPLRANTGEQVPFSQDIEADGRIVLTDLTFETGSAQLADQTFTSLTELASYLAERPGLTIALVGHTDAQGALAGNIALSKRRAGSVLERLVAAYGVNRNQLEAEGMGYLAPVASNLTAEGRTRNRRVEAIITSTGP